MSNPTTSIPRRKMGPLESLFAKHFRDGVVVVAQQEGPHWRRIRIACEHIPHLDYTPGQHVRMELHDPFSLYGILRPVETMRTYTVWDWSVHDRSFELRVHLYGGDGIGLRWARAAKAGDPVRFWGPQGDFTTKEAPFHLFVGEETASVAFAPMMRALPAEASVLCVLESETPAHELTMAETPWIQRVHRHGASPIGSPTLLAKLVALDLPSPHGIAYVAGEARTCQRVRDWLVKERHWPREAVLVKPFWSAGKRGLH